MYNVKVDYEEGCLPKYQKNGDVGADLVFCGAENVRVRKGDKVLLSTGLRVEMTNEIMATIHPRSGMAAKQGVFAITGIIDSGYRGEIKVNLVNLGDEDVIIEPYQRIAQIVFNPVIRPTFSKGIMSESERGEGGFGHTGKFMTQGVTEKKDYDPHYG